MTYTKKPYTKKPYTKKPYTQLHHIEKRTEEDGSIAVDVHLIHRPPVNGSTMPFVMDRNRPNRRLTMTAETQEQAAALVFDVKYAHRYEPAPGHSEE